MVQSIDEARRRQVTGGSRTPPHDLQAEESLLGAMLMSREAISVGFEHCRTEDFYKPSHGHVFDAIAGLYAKGEPVDPVTVADELRRAGLLEVIGGPSLLIALQASTPATSNAGKYARIVSDHSLLRRLIAASAEIAEMGYEVPDDVHGAIDRAESLVFQIGQRRVADTLAPIRDLLSQSLDRLEALYDRGESITGVPTGYIDIDEQLSGLQPSNLVIIGARPAMGKALALDTPIPTPQGWTTMGDVEVGDLVYDEKGHPCRVAYTSPVFLDHKCYRIRLDDGSEIVADAGHRWLVYDRSAWKSLRERARRLRKGPPTNPSLARDQSERWSRPRVVTTEDMLREGVSDSDRPNWYLLLTEPLEAPEVELPVDPYVLGCWLGDGTSSSSEMTIGVGDEAHFLAEFAARGYCLSKRQNLQWATTPVSGPGRWQGYRGPYRVLARELQEIGLLRGSVKHIPPVYLRAPVKQRLALLQGIMDTDGTVTNRNGTVELCLANRSLLEQVWELVASLGHKPHVIRRRTVTVPSGRKCEAWRFCWTPRDPVFLMERKARKLAEGATGRAFGRSTRRAIVSIEETPSVPVRCISVTSDSHLFLAGRAMIPTHNTSVALGMASHAAMQANVPVLFFSLEMSHLELTQRLLSAEAQVDSSRMRNGRLHDSDWPKISHAIGRLAEAPIFIDDNPNLTVMDIRAKARRLKSREGLGLVVIDYVQLMTGRGSAENRQVEVSEISRGLKILARELEVPVVALSQLSRTLEARADKRPMLADLRESGCMPARTRLLRADTGGWVTLGELVLSQERPLVWSLDDRWRMVPRRVTNVFPSGIRPVFKLRLASGREVTATGNHPFRRIGGWVPLEELRVGDEIAVPRRIPAPQEPPPAWKNDELILLAHLLGDGSIGPNGVKYATADPANKEAVENSANALFGIDVAGKMQGRTWLLWLPSPYRLTHGRSHPVRNWLEPFGLWGSRSHNKFIPSDLLGQVDEKIEVFLRHLWATDGSITVRRNRRGPYVVIYYATTSRRLAEDVADVLARLDIQTRIYKARKDGYRDSWHVHVTGARNMERFLVRVGCHGRRGDIIPQALAVVRALKPNPNRDVIPFEVSKDVKTSLALEGKSHRWLAETLGERYCGSYLLGSQQRPRRFSRERLAAIGRQLGDEKLIDLAGSDVMWDSIIEIVPAGQEPTFDATVEGTHNFVADGIFAHNSLEQDADVVMFVYRDEMYNPDSPDKGTAEIIVAKHRNGPTGVARLAFLNHQARFANMARDL